MSTHNSAHNSEDQEPEGHPQPECEHDLIRADEAENSAPEPPDLSDWDSALDFATAPIVEVPIDEILPASENQDVYNAISPNRPDIVALAKNLKANGQINHLILTADMFIVSGHCRLAAAKVAGFATLRCQILKIPRDHPKFRKLLAAANGGRDKSAEERLREELFAVDPEQAYFRLLMRRGEGRCFAIDPMDLRDQKVRALISPARAPFLSAVQAIIARLQPYWPLSDRQIHYQLLNDPPLIHASKPGSRYANDKRSYVALSNLLTRARHEGSIDHEVIADGTRPVLLPNCEPNTGAFIQNEIKWFLQSYRRDLQQSQFNHIEVVAEKLTVQGILKSVCEKYCLPLTIGRGYASTRPKYDLAQRFRTSGKDALVLLIVSDFDPDGDEIAHDWAASLKYLFKIEDIHPIKVALRKDQIEELGLPKAMLKAKSKGSNYARFKSEHGSDDVYELEALEPGTLQRLLEEAIESVMQLSAFDAEVVQEKLDAAFLERVRRRMIAILRERGIGEQE